MNHGCTHRKLVIIRVTRVTLLIILSSVVCSAQSGRPDDAPKPPPPPPTPARVERPANTPNRSRSTKPPPPPRKPEPVAHVTLIVRPSDSRVILDNQEFSAVDSTGVLTFKSLKLDSHVLVVRRTGYRDRSFSFTPSAGENSPFEIVLEPLPGVLRVTPSVSGAEIAVRSLDASRETLTRFDSIENLEVPAGDYEIKVSKSEYETLTRRITIEPAQSVYLKPQLEPVEISKPAPPPPRKVITAPMTSTLEVSGKYLIVRLRGASGELSNIGSIDVTANKTISGLADIKGSLSGHPCEVEFVRMENVAEAALLETPGPSNQWSIVAIRVRPKDQKRLIHFVINWRSLAKAQTVR
jgi:hypothetical protein